MDTTGDATRPVESRTIADRFVLTGEIGRGGTGVVWRGEDQLIGRPVAVKEISFSPEIPDDERDEVKQRILREVRAAGRLNHPGIVTVHDVIWQDGAICVVMELVNGSSLDKLVNRTGPMDAAAASKIAVSILDALEESHRAGVIHRDVKPHNIMVLDTGGVKLADFGIAQVQAGTRLTQTGYVVGTPAFLAPEQISGARPTPATDLWQLGVTLYHMVEGRSPFDRDDYELTIAAVLGHTPPPPSCGEPLASIILALLDKNPKRRPGAGQVREVLESLQPTNPHKPRKRRYGPRTFRPRRKWRGVAVGAAVVLVTTGAFGAGILNERYLLGPARLGLPEVVPWDSTNVQQQIVGSGSVEFGRDVKWQWRGCTNGQVKRGGKLIAVPSQTSDGRNSCAAEHDAEIWDSAHLPPQPERGAYENLAKMFCAGSFADYERRTAWPGIYTGARVVALVPSASKRAEAGWTNNMVYCALWRPDGTKFPGHHNIVDTPAG